MQEVSLADSIVQGDTSLKLNSGNVHMKRITILGRLEVHRLWANEVLITDQATVTDTQTGCFRFSASPEDGRLPRPYESHWIKGTDALFISRRFGDPGYCQLSEAAPVELKRGAENGSEIGAFSHQLNPIKLDSLRAKVEEFMPFGLLPVFVYET